MKTTSTLSLYHRAAQLTGFILVLAIMVSCTASQQTQAGASAKVKVSGKTTQGGKTVRIYPDLVKRVMHVKNLEKQDLDFYVFQADGSIVLHYRMSNGERKQISGLDRGTYVYQVFSGDEMAESGKMQIK